MSAHVLLNLLNELGKSDKMRGLSSTSSFFRNEFNKLCFPDMKMMASPQDCICLFTILYIIYLPVMFSMKKRRKKNMINSA